MRACVPPCICMCVRTYVYRCACVRHHGVRLVGMGVRDVLRQVIVPVLDNQICNDTYRDNHKFLTDAMICAGEGVKDTCKVIHIHLLVSLLPI